MSNLFRRFAVKISEWLGTPWAFFLSLGMLVSGMYCHWSSTWQTFVYVASAIATFVMMSIVQATQTRQDRVLHLKLDELIRVQSHARDAFAGLECASEEDIDTLQKEVEALRERRQSATQALHKVQGSCSESHPA